LKIDNVQLNAFLACSSLSPKPARDSLKDFAVFLRSEYARWGKVIRAAGIHAD